MMNEKEDQRAFFEVSHWTIQTNQNTIQQLKEENKSLKERLRASAVAKRQRTQRLPVSKEIEKLLRQEHGLRRRHDELVQERTRLRSLLRERQSETRQLSQQARVVQSLDEQHEPELRALRQLENRLEKVALKHGEALSIRRTYEQILARLREERVTFDSQLAALETNLDALRTDLHELALMEADAKHGRDAARRDLWDLREQQQREESRMARGMMEKRRQVLQTRQAARGMQARTADQLRENPRLRVMQQIAQESRAQVAGRESQRGTQGEDDQTTLMELEEALRQIKELTGADNPEEVVSKFQASQKTSLSLARQRMAAEERIEDLAARIEREQGELDTLRFSVVQASSAKARVESMRQEQAQLEAEAEGARRQLERLRRTLLELRAGASHVAAVVTRAAVGPPVPHGPAVAVDATLAACADHLARLQSVLPRDPAVTGAALRAVVQWRRQQEEQAPAAAQGAYLEAKLVHQGLEPYGGYTSGGSGSSSDDEGEYGTDRDAIKRRAAAAAKTNKPRGGGTPG